MKRMASESRFATALPRRPAGDNEVGRKHGQTSRKTDSDWYNSEISRKSLSLQPSSRGLRVVRLEIEPELVEIRRTLAPTLLRSRHHVRHQRRQSAVSPRAEEQVGPPGTQPGAPKKIEGQDSAAPGRRRIIAVQVNLHSTPIPKSRRADVKAR